MTPHHDPPRAGHDHHHHLHHDSHGTSSADAHADDQAASALTPEAGAADDGIDRRGFLKCMAWAGTGLLWTMKGGLITSARFGAPAVAEAADDADFTFVQLSDSHIGFSKEANPDVVGTMQAAIDRVNALPKPPAFVLHTGDLTHLSRPEEFDTVAQVLKGARAGNAFYVPGEHDVFTDDGKQYLERYGKGTLGRGWQSFDYKGTHFVGLNNVSDLQEGGLGAIGDDQLAWLEDDVAPLSSDTPIVVYAHVPLWMVYPDWGWGTQDAEQALGYLKRFGSVTVLNGHIHQVLQKVEGNVTFHTAMATGFPQPAPGTAPSPGPMKVPAEQLRKVLGLTQVNFVRRGAPLAIVDTPLA